MTTGYITSSSSSGDNFEPNDALFKKYFCPSMFGINRRGETYRKDQKTFEDEVLLWCMNAISEGEGYIKGCRGYEGIDKAIDILIQVAKASNATPESLSSVFLNEIKRDIWENSAILSNIKPSTTYESRHNQDEEFKQHTKILNHLNEDWYEYNFVSNAIRGMNQWAFTCGTGYITPLFDPEASDRGGEIIPFVKGWADVLPVGMGDDLDIQRAYACIVRRELDYRTVVRKWPHKSHMIRPDRSEPSMFRKVASLVTGSSNIYELMSDSRKRSDSSPTIDVFYIYVDDFSINPLSKALPAGSLGSHPNASWSYDVPAVGEQFQIGFNPDGSIKTRKATREDARLYPNKRLIICTRICILYDGPSLYWHGKYPVVKYSPDQWIWSYLGYSLVAQVASLNDSLTSMMQMMEDSLKLQLDPPTMIDEQTPPNLAKKSLRQPGLKIRGRVQMGDILRTIHKDYAPKDVHFNYLKLLVENIARQLGTPDLRSLQQAKQVPGGDSVEKYFAAAGAIVTDMSMQMDKPLWELADMNRFNFFQFYSLPRRLRLLGKEGLTKEDLDFDPMNMIPATLPNESPSQVADNGNKVYSSTRLQRAKLHIANFSTSIERTSAHEITSMQRKLMKFQLAKVNPANGIISPETLAKEAGVKNWGVLKGDTELEKIASYLDIQTKLGIRKMLQEAAGQAMIQQAMQSQTPEGQAAEALKGLAGAAAGANGNGTLGHQLPGRPPEFQEAPRLEDKGDRSTITGS